MKRDLATPPKNRQEGISLDVMYKALEQLRMILINDVQKKLVERYAYRALENYWKKMENVSLLVCVGLCRQRLKKNTFLHKAIPVFFPQVAIPFCLQ